MSTTTFTRVIHTTESSGVGRVLMTRVSSPPPANRYFYTNGWRISVGEEEVVVRYLYYTINSIYILPPAHKKLIY